jgi:predicted ATP-dependent serine protease
MNDDDAKLERDCQATWVCSNCGRRYPRTINTCQRCMDRALEADRKKLRELGVSE